MLTPDSGRTLGKYRLIAEIARGGMGIVYLAAAQGVGGFNKLLVIKELKPELVEDPAFLTMFLDEARLAARLNQPNIVQTNEVGNDGHRYFLAMDYLDGRGLDRVRRRAQKAQTKLPLALQIRVLCEVLTGLDYAHKLADFDGKPLNIVHRDVSPSNVFLTFDGQVKLLDFGIAKAVDSSSETNAGQLKGKLGYMAPEQARGIRADHRADVFSAGVVLWEALVGRRMHQSSNEPQLIWALATGDIPRASSAASDVPPELDAICAKAMAFDREDRYASAADFRDALEHYLMESGTAIGSREVGAFVADMFSDERSTMNAMIEAHVARERNGGREDGETEVSIPSLMNNTPSKERPSLTPFTAPHAETGSINKPGPNSSASTQSSARVATRPPGPQKLIIASAVGAVVLVAGLTVLLRNRHSTPTAASPPPVTARVTPPTAAPTAPTPATPSTPGVAPTPAGDNAAALRTVPSEPVVLAGNVAPNGQQVFVDVEIRVTPSNAHVTVDGEVVNGNPYRSQYLLDNAVHEVKASAPGYDPKVETMTFNANAKLSISLDRVVVARAQPAAPVRTIQTRQAPTRPAVATHPGEVTPPPAVVTPPPAVVTPPPVIEAKPAGSDVNPAGGSKPRRPIDATNPYGDR